MLAKRGVLVLFFGLFPLTMVLFQTTVRVMGYRVGYWMAFAAYWAVLIGATLAIVGIRGVRALYIPEKWSGLLIGAIAFIPAIAVFFIAFLPALRGLDAPLWILLTFAALLNGITEELFWRGVPLHFSGRGDRRLWVVSSLAGFTLWHVTLTLIPGMHYQGGAAALVGGAMAMGVLWLFVTLKTRSILFATLAHVLVNFFAFSEMIVENWRH